MSKHIISGFITYEKKPYQEQPEIGFSAYEPNAELWPNKVVVRAHSIEVEVPNDFDPRVPLVTRLEEEKRKVKAEFARKITEIEKKIQSLLAIECGASS